jgi:hypothetical protein
VSYEPNQYSTLQNQALRVIATSIVARVSKELMGQEERFKVIPNSNDAVMYLTVSEHINMVINTMKTVLDAFPREHRPPLEWFISGATIAAEQMEEFDPEPAPEITEKDVEDFVAKLFGKGSQN